MPAEGAGSDRQDFAEAKKESKNRQHHPKYPETEWRHRCGQRGVSHVRSPGAGGEPLKLPLLSPHETIKALLWGTNGVFLEQAQNEAFQHKMDDFHHRTQGRDQDHGDVVQGGCPPRKARYKPLCCQDTQEASHRVRAGSEGKKKD